ncbi:MAG: molybdopterin-dependent oxidoreductase, partial [Deltaproteobacteria bacterium]|nr:molybdopterin-dependent oxidoreductase [Deltaproteobacteria bacterium]
ITNETYYVLQKVARLMGTNNVDFCARLCHQASVSGLGATIGYGAPTCSLKDLIGSDLVLLWGTNLANNQPVAVKYLHYAKEAGTRVVVINTTIEKGLQNYWIPSNPKSALFGSKIADDFVIVKAGGDIALATAVAKLLIDWGAVDRTFVDAHTIGFEAYENHIRAQSMEDLLGRAGVSFAQVEWLARLVARARTMVTVWSMGLTQHRFGTQNVMAVADLHLMRGMIGREKTGLLPIRGHSGVQGGGEMAVNPHKFPGGVAINAENAEKLAAEWGHPVPATPGLTTAEMVDAAGRGELDFLYNIGGNLYATLPDPAQVVEAFGKIRVRVHQDINLNTSTLLDPGEIVLLLPAQTRYEQRGGGTSTNTERRIRFSPEIPGHPQIGEARPEWEIPGLVAAAARPDLSAALVFDDASDIRREIPRLIPSYAGIENMRESGDWVQWGGERLCENGDFPTFPDRRARFVPVDLPFNEVPDGWYALVNRRGKQFNSMVFANEDTLQGGLGRGDVLISAVDAGREGLADGDPVRLWNSHGEFRGVARVNDIRKGHLQVYWPEANALLPRVLDPVSLEPDYHTNVRLERLA